MKFLLLTILICLISLTAFAQDARDNLEVALADEGLSMEEFGIISMYYYQNPQPEKLLSGLKAALTQEELLTDAPSFKSTAHFFAAVAHNDQSFLNKLKNLQANYSGLQKDSLREIINQAEDFESPLPDSPIHLDYLWAEFMATGEERPVKRIISVLDYPQEGKNIILAAAAEWSLGANAYQHEKVYQIIQKESLSAKGQAKQKLDSIFKRVDEAKGNILFAAIKKAGDLGYNTEEMDIIFDEGNKSWNEYFRSRKIFPEEYILSTGRNYQTLYFAPKASALGGDLWVFVDRDTREVIYFVRGE